MTFTFLVDFVYFPQYLSFQLNSSVPLSLQIHPFSVRQFSHGPRMCIGRRFAELEIQVAISKLVSK